MVIHDQLYKKWILPINFQYDFKIVSEMVSLYSMVSCQKGPTFWQGTLY